MWKRLLEVFLFLLVIAMYGMCASGAMAKGPACSGPAFKTSTWTRCYADALIMHHTLRYQLCQVDTGELNDRCLKTIPKDPTVLGFPYRFIFER